MVRVEKKVFPLKFPKDICNPKMSWKWSFHTILIVAIVKEVCHKWRFLYLKILFYQLKDFAKTPLYLSDHFLRFSSVRGQSFCLTIRLSFTSQSRVWLKC